MKTSPDIEKIIDALAHLIGGDRHISHPAMPKLVDAIHCVNHAVYDGFEPFGRDEFIEREILSDGAGDIPIWPIDARFAFHGEDEFGPFWEFQRVSTLNPATMRGRLRVVVPRMYKLEITDISGGGEKGSMTGVFALMGGGHVIEAAIRQPYRIGAKRPVRTDFHAEGSIRYGHGVQLRNYYNWSVLLGDTEGLPRARFVTDPTGVREAFRLRDIPPGKRRRAALRHWVRSHWRQKRDLSAADMTWIEKYLRGAVEFNWNGLRCKIEPSPHDVALAAKQKKCA